MGFNYKGFRAVEDHEEWTKLAADSESGTYVMQGFLAHDETMKQPVRDQQIVETAFKRVAKRKGWNERLTEVAGPMRTHIPLDGDAPLADRADAYQIDLSYLGFWWAFVPVDYLGQVENSRMEFRIRQGSSQLVLKAYEAFVKRYGVGLRIDEFGQTIEQALTKDGTLMVYDDHPAAERETREFFEE